MTRLLEEAFEAARIAPPEMQDELARVLRSYLGGDDRADFALTADDEEAVARSRDAFAKGEIATDEEIAAIWAKPLERFEARITDDALSGRLDDVETEAVQEHGIKHTRDL